MRRVAIFLGVLVLLILGAAFAVRRYIDADHFRPLLESRLSAALGRTVTIGSLELSIAAGVITADGISVSEDPAFGVEPFLHAESLRVGVDLAPLVFSRELNVTSILIEQPEIRLIHGSDGRANYATLGMAPISPSTHIRADPPERDSAGQETLPKMKIDSVEIKDGRVSFFNRGIGAAPRIVDKVNLELKGITMTSEVPFSLSASLSDDETIELSGTAGPLDRSNPARTPFKADLHIAKVDLGKTGLLDDASAVDGVAMLNASIAQTGDIAYLKGRATIGKLKLVKNGTPATELVDIDFTLEQDSLHRTGKLTRCSIGIGHAVANLVGHYELGGPAPVIHAQLAGQGMELADLAAILPALGVALPKGVALDRGTAFADLSAEGALDKLVVAGKIGVADARMSNYDLGTKLKVLSALAGVRMSRDTDIRLFSANIRMTPTGTSLDGIHVVVPAVGDITGSGSVNTERVLAFKMRLIVGKTRGLVPTAAALGSIPFTVTGTSDEPVFHPDVKAFASDKTQFVTHGADSAKVRIKALVTPKKK
jgi:hypothetical protein